METAVTYFVRFVFPNTGNVQGTLVHADSGFTRYFASREDAVKYMREGGYGENYYQVCEETEE